MKNRIRFLFPRVILSFISLFLMILLAEIALRFISIKDCPLLFKQSYERGYTLTPNFLGYFADVPVRINGQGLRENKDIVMEKPKGVKRIIGLGDSVGFGYGLEERETSMRKLETILNKNGKKFEVINGSVTGYNTFQERKLFEDDLNKFKPDLVILNFVLNDISGDFHVANDIFRAVVPFAAGDYSPADLTGFKKGYYFLYEKLFLFRLLHYKFPSLFGFNPPHFDKKYSNYAEETIFFYKEGYYPRKIYVNAFDKTKEEILKIRDLSKENNAELLIVIFPVEVQIEDKLLRKPQEILSKFCQKNSLRCLDLLPLMERQKEKVFLDLGHPNVFGSGITAEEIAGYLRKNHLL